ncbi:hypothetical protein KIN20_015113 [Parelaphostrongylus tenuis]|uniref:Uncharacterized protein n=1 Tax=Parelaphostrongylus tenuis TaxID=148309 RepID=A0AAD5MFN3_PARTN|nr:hypothetical protein KIN20_015113 [Parelaphostrongylus tenuis]
MEELLIPARSTRRSTGQQVTQECHAGHACLPTSAFIPTSPLQQLNETVRKLSAKKGREECDLDMNN